ncbi:hypothetical protein HPB47_016640 [Ixodes persulcatus]|uniref:Uncharacterized protein n=1 Tax=Ixodes persulcatus TaxID=34615 RepID=A0AC60QST5_IXOPE|nr:hypothetical protein HPB47_016640 [Ixodes persulcatus]
MSQPPQLYSFGSDSVNEFGTRMTRQETEDEFNNKVGSYSYVDALGVTRLVKRIRDFLGIVDGTTEFLWRQSSHRVCAILPKRSPLAKCDIKTHAPRPYLFGYDNTDEFGTRRTRQETGDAFNNKVGSYSYVDALGITRTVKYVADDAGFRATVDTNEPGTKTSAPADAPFFSASVEGPHPVVVKALHPTPVAVHGVHAAPVSVRAIHAAPVVQTPISYALAKSL